MAFWGGVVVGSLGLNLKEEPLKSWLANTTAEAYVSLQPPQQDICWRKFEMHAWYKA